MASPQRRPRDKGGTDPRDVAAKGFESSNSTMAKFLGGTQKSWMTVPHVKPFSPTNHTPRANSIRPGNANPTQEDNSTLRLDMDGHRAHIADQRSTAPRSGCIGSINAEIAANIEALSDAKAKKPQQCIDAVLPSPAPSDEPRQESVHIIDLEERDQQPQLNQQKSHDEENNGNRLNELAERYGGVEELEKRLRDADPRQNDLSRPTNDNRAMSPQSSQSIFSGTKRAHEMQLESRKRPQALQTPSSQGFQNVSLQTMTQRAERSYSSRTGRTLSNTLVRSFLAEVDRRIEEINGKSNRKGRDIEIPRLGLLHDACNHSDYFYLVLHQLFCVDSMKGISSQLSSYGLTSEHIDGMMLLTHLLLPNDQMDDDALAWFSTFPLTLEKLLQNWPDIEASRKKVLLCLSRFPEYWLNIRQHCNQRSYPPLVDEISGMLGADSIVLQRVIGRAILRDIWPAPHDECHNEGERLFHKNQQDVLARQYQEGSNTVSQNAEIVAEYQRIWSRHRQHIQIGAQHNALLRQRQDLVANVNSPMAPPQQANNRIQSAINGGISHRLNPQTSVPSNDLPEGSLYINTQISPISPINIGYSPTVPSSSYANIQSNSTIHREPLASQNMAAPSIQVSTNSVQQRRRGRPRRDQVFAMAPSSSTSQISTATGNQHNFPVNRQEISMPLDVTALQNIGIHPDQSRNMQVRNAQQSQFGLLTTRPFDNGLRSTSGPQSVSQQRSAYIPLQSQFQVQSAPNLRSPQSPIGPYNSQRGIYQFPPRHNSSFPPPTVPLSQLLPSSGIVRSNTEPPNSLLATLHQVHARSPTLTSVDAFDRQDGSIKSFAFVRRLAVMPNRLDHDKRHFRWTFEVSKENYDLLTEDAITENGAPPTRTVRNGSRLCRIRAIKAKDMGEIAESDWVTSETVWPNGVAILLNGSALEIRKKIHHGKDLPVDVTKYIQEGKNTISIATIRPNYENQAIYAIGLETIQFTNSTKIRDEILEIDLVDALKRIVDQPKTFDPDVQVVNSKVILDVTDPYTSRLYNTPVRGQTCRHNQCFDLDVFLETRLRKTPSHPSIPEQFKCPICGADARPQSLVKDLFFVAIRKELVRIGRLDVKAIILDEQGNWNIKEEEETGESGDGSGKLPSQFDESANFRAGKVSLRGESQIIELDD